jgi:excisionase family DNA binding protein
MEESCLNPVESNRTPIQAYTIGEAAAALRMSDKSVRRQISRGNLRRCAKFGRVLIPRKDVETFFERFSS